MGQRVEAQAEELLRAEQREAERPMLQQRHRRPARIRQRGQQQRIGPDHEAGDDAGKRTLDVGAVPDQAADQRRRELRDGGEA